MWPMCDTCIEYPFTYNDNIFYVYYCNSIIHAQNGWRLVWYECVLTIFTDLLVVSVADRVDYNDICAKLIEDVLLVQ